MIDLGLICTQIPIWLQIVLQMRTASPGHKRDTNMFLITEVVYQVNIMRICLLTTTKSYILSSKDVTG